MSIEAKRLDDVRIRRPKEHDDLLDIFKKEKIFASNKNALVFAASLGFKKQQRLSFLESSEPIMLRVFDDNTDIPFIYSLALAETGDISMMTKNKFKEAVLIFEEYANGGLSYIRSVLDPATALVSLEAIISELDETNTEDMFKDW
ncbi:DNA phosphorothioation-associated protein 4 [Shewanella sp. 1_MG-2023]|uniref:DNA phosphorothioation-associated protein 4 n=1 Tax=unclassified Shewanella TaxID=196818 RepID=UPI0026E1BEA3|nr:MULTISPECIES: DNA phosphorothioation-associated protein 4 [unclassified Shewanella]MDO6610520.1 DNA phosphorothioation-associated protein 4 [Shewanella sp. 7_MG-2023]MDO6770645.1 DNA phosphorothioation-associated protein 4 [Shewanella sp. 2_MG-2023]MDO6795031.1 DNA phosphorothioation-associated protein 4 [Shewanella sp. 1_MG-2023]